MFRARGCLLFLIVCSVVFGQRDAVAVPPSFEHPRQGERGVFVPHGGYMRSNYRAHLARRAAERRLAMFAPGQRLSLSGTRSLPVICVAFKNVAAPFATAEYETALFAADSDVSMSAYYRDISQGELTVQGRVLGWYQAPEDDTYYENGNNGNGVPFGELLTFALKSADEELDFGQFDNDGPDGVANSGDDDGIVDTVVFVHPETGAECDEGTNIWSHSWHYNERLFGHSGPFITNDVRRDTAGHPVVGDDGDAKIVVDDYTIQPGLSCRSTDGHPKIVEVGVFCHEFGHALGLPDLYDRTPSSGADSEGVGNWCLMAGGSYGGDGKHPERPTRMSAWCKYYLGWSTPRIVNTAEDMELDPVAVRNDALRLNVAGTNGLEYFLVEYRRHGAGAAHTNNWDEFLPASGLAVWHCDERVGGNFSTWPFAPNNEGQNDSPVRINVSPPPLFKSKRPLVALLQADKLMQLENNKNRGDAGDLFSGGTLEDDTLGKAGTRSYSGEATNIALSDIAITANSATGKIKVPDEDGPDAAALVAAPPVERVVAEVSAERKRDLEHVKPKLGRLSFSPLDIKAVRATLNPGEVGAVANSTPDVIREILGPIPAAAMAQLSADLRTNTIQRADEVDTGPQRAVKALLMKSNDAIKETQFGFGIDSDRIAFVSGLRISATQESPKKDGQERLKTDADLREALSLGELTFLSETNDAMDRVQWFSQAKRVGDNLLPVFDTRVSLHYSDADELTAATSRTIPRLQGIVGAGARTTSAEAAKATETALGIPAAAIGEITKGVFVPRAVNIDDATEGRLAFEVTIHSDPFHEPLRTYVDAQSLKILDIR